MSVGQVEGFFVDSCILLPKPLEAVMQTCNRFMREASGRCFISSSVKTEGLELIDRSHDTIVVNFHEKLKPFLEKKGITKITARDGELFADFFAEQKAEFGKVAPKRTNVPNEILSAIEGFIANQVHSIRSGQEIPTDYFLGATSMQLAVVKHDLEVPFRSSNEAVIQPEASFCSAIANGSMVDQKVLRNTADITHLASALEYQFRKNKWVIFVTTDQDEILSRTHQFKEMFLQCSKPEWALDYYRIMTREKAPVQFIEEIESPTNNQKLVIEAWKSVADSEIETHAILDAR